MFLWLVVFTDNWYYVPLLGISHDHFYLVLPPPPTVENSAVAYIAGFIAKAVETPDMQRLPKPTYTKTV